MTPTSLAYTDSFVLRFQAAGDPLADGSARLERFLEAIERYSGELMPTVVAGVEGGREYSREAVRKALDEAKDRPFGAVCYLKRPSPDVSLSVSISPEPVPPQFLVSLHVTPLSFFAEPGHVEARSRSMIEMVRAWARHFPSWYARAHYSADEDLAVTPGLGPHPDDTPPEQDDTPPEQRFDRVVAMFWLNLLRKELVDAIGRDRVLSTPAHLVEELPSGAVLIVTRPTVADFASEEGRRAQARALVHLRPDLDYDTVLRELLERSSTIAPVEPRFDPDLAELLLKVANQTTTALVQRRYAELNAYRPPEVTEWLPASAAPPFDVADPKAELDRYSYLAEQLVALLHTVVPRVYDATLESLTAVDYEMWLSEYPTYEREKVDGILIPSAGAYLGEVLVGRLGGRWVPRRNLEETQVVVGDRAWLPFVRARRYLQTRQSVLDYSLTKLYREAERHLRSLRSA